MVEVRVASRPKYMFVKMVQVTNILPRYNSSTLLQLLKLCAVKRLQNLARRVFFMKCHVATVFSRTLFQSTDSKCPKRFLKGLSGIYHTDARTHALLGSDMMLQLAVVLWIRCLLVENVCFAKAKHSFSYRLR